VAPKVSQPKPPRKKRRSKEERQAYQAPQAVREALRFQLLSNAQDCVECGKCLKDCAFLQTHGTPQEIAFCYDPESPKFHDLAFECSLCGLCAAVCPPKVGVDPFALFQEMRREAVDRGKGCFSQHDGIVSYEKKGNSRWLSWYGLPEGCETVFFPGCTLPGSQSDNVEKLFDLLQETIPDLGIVLDCCTKPSHDLGREDFFGQMFGELRDYLVESGVKKVLVACPSCYQAIDLHGDPIQVQTVYEYLEDKALPEVPALDATITVHDPCSTRDQPAVHQGVRSIIERRSLNIEEMRLHGKATTCCGEGGSVPFFAPEMAEKWTEKRAEAAAGKRIITYCSGCVNFIGKKTPTTHVLDVLFQPAKALAGEVKITRAPFTYLNRFLLKRRFQKKLPGVRSRERPFGIKPGGLSTLWKKLLVAVGFTGAVLFWIW
jgi:Fe-S oxidoreductase